MTLIRNDNINTALLYTIGGVICFLLIAYSLITMIIMITLGTPPESIEECFSMLQVNRFNGLLRLDVLTVFVMPFYYLLFYSLYIVLKDTNKHLISISTILVFAGLTLFLSAPSVFSYLYLSDKYSNALTEIEKNQLISAGQAIIASDIWHGTGAKIGGILIQSGALIISIVMLKGNDFKKFTAFTGIITHGLDLLHIVIGFFLPTVGIILMAIAGPLYLLWFPLIGIRLFKLKINMSNDNN